MKDLNVNAELNMDEISASEVIGYGGGAPAHKYDGTWYGAIFGFEGLLGPAFPADQGTERESTWQALMRWLD